MIKQFIIAVACMIMFSTYVFAQEHADHSQHDTMKHSEPDDQHSDHSDHSDHTGHTMKHSTHDDDDDDEMDHSDHSGHTGHDMEHSTHKHSNDDETEIDHSDHSDHTKHDMDHSAHDQDDAHDHSGMTHGDDHVMDDPNDHTMLHGEDDKHTSHHGDHHHHDDSHIMDHEGGMIMGQNLDKLPSSCTSISQEIEITVRAGAKHAKKFPGMAFAFDEQQWHVEPCSKITWHFVNDDEVRHQFMMHGLPKYLYKLGMFHLESTGPRKISGTMIVPAADETYLVHCDIAQHMEKGMKAQLVVGNGGEDIPSIPGLTPYIVNDTYKAEDLSLITDKNSVSGKSNQSIVQQIADFFNDNVPFSGMLLVGLLFGVMCTPLLASMFALRKKTDTEDT